MNFYLAICSIKESIWQIPFTILFKDYKRSVMAKYLKKNNTISLLILINKLVLIFKCKRSVIFSIISE